MTRVTKSKHVILPAAKVKKTKQNTMGLTLIGSGRLRKLSQNETLRIKERAGSYYSSSGRMCAEPLRARLQVSYSGYATATKLPCFLVRPKYKMKPCSPINIRSTCSRKHENLTQPTC